MRPVFTVSLIFLALTIGLCAGVSGSVMGYSSAYQNAFQTSFLGIGMTSGSNPDIMCKYTGSCSASATDSDSGCSYPGACITSFGSSNPAIDAYNTEITPVSQRGYDGNIYDVITHPGSTTRSSGSSLFNGFNSGHCGASCRY